MAQPPPKPTKSVCYTRDDVDAEFVSFAAFVSFATRKRRKFPAHFIARCYYDRDAAAWLYQSACGAADTTDCAGICAIALTCAGATSSRTDTGNFAVTGGTAGGASGRAVPGIASGRTIHSTVNGAINSATVFAARLYVS